MLLNFILLYIALILSCFLLHIFCSVIHFSPNFEQCIFFIPHLLESFILFLPTFLKFLRSFYFFHFNLFLSYLVRLLFTVSFSFFIFIFHFFSIPAYFIFIYHPHIFFSSQLIRDIYPLEGPSHSRLEVLELSMSIRIFDLGNENQVRILFICFFLYLFIDLFVDPFIFSLKVFVCIVLFIDLFEFFSDDFT